MGGLAGVRRGRIQYVAHLPTYTFAPGTEPFAAPTAEGQDAKDKHEALDDLTEDDDGWALLPPMGAHSLEECKQILRLYITMNYHKHP